MSSRSIRLRLSLMVSGLFALTLVVVGLTVRDRLQRSLEGDAQAAAETVLVDFLETGAVASPPFPVPRIVFFDDQGREITPEEFEALVGAADGDMADSVAMGNGFTLPADALLPPSFAVEYDPFTGMAVAGEAFSMTVVEGTPEDFVLASPIVVGGTELAVGVASPRAPIEELIAATTTAGLVLLPVLTLMVGGATWMTASRALRPVEEIRRQVERTNLGRLDLRVPMAGTDDEIDRLAGTMNEMLDRLDSAADRQRRFISDASHELRSPVTATIATLETVEVTSADAWDEVAFTIGREQHRLAGLVDDLLLLAQIDEIGLGNDDDVDLDELAIQEATRPHPCLVSVNIDAPCRVRGSERLLRRVVSNLADNATRHAATRVEISVGRTVTGAGRLRVDDDGPGVPRLRRDEVFERFARLDEARAHGCGGAGLGLAIARNIAEAHGAALVVTDSPLGGARFELRF